RYWDERRPPVPALEEPGSGQHQDQGIVGPDDRRDDLRRDDGDEESRLGRGPEATDDDKRQYGDDADDPEQACRLERQAVLVGDRAERDVGRGGGRVVEVA